MDVIGRATEAAAVEAALDITPGAVVLQGEAGIGKTTLWLAGIDAAAARGYRVVVPPSAAEARFSYVGLADLLGQVGDGVLQACPRSSGGRSRRRCSSGSPICASTTGRWRPRSCGRCACCGRDPAAWRSTTSSGSIRPRWPR